MDLIFKGRMAVIGLILNFLDEFLRYEFKLTASIIRSASIETI